MTPMKRKIAEWLQVLWYKDLYVSGWMMPWSMIYVDIIRFRRFLYNIGIFKRSKLPVPVIIVGNITVGGTGKTPLVIHLVQLLKDNGYNPGVISRGYSGEANQTPQTVTAESDTALVGDEAVLLAKRCACPVVVGVKRVEAAKHLLANHYCDVIISDDGLQHYALRRDIEIVVIDGDRRFGNGYCLPSGPLREPQTRIEEVDFVVVNGGKQLQEGEFAMQCQGQTWVNLLSGEQQPASYFQRSACHALAAIGNPNRFFAQIKAAGIETQNHPFPDHYVFTADDLQFNDDKPLLMTEKDAVKCVKFAQANFWYLPVTAQLPAAFSQQLLTLLKQKSHG